MIREVQILYYSRRDAIETTQLVDILEILRSRENFFEIFLEIFNFFFQIFKKWPFSISDLQLWVIIYLTMHTIC